MRDPKEVPSLMRRLERRFLFVTLCWCIGIERGARGLGPLPEGKKHPRDVQDAAAYASRRMMREFFFSWLVQTETLARHFDAGVVRRARFDETMLWGGGQFLYDLFASGCVRGPYLFPWDNAHGFRERVLKPAVSLMHEDARDKTLVIPPEAKMLLELRGLTFDF